MFSGIICAIAAIVLVNDVMEENSRMNALSAQLYRLIILTQDYVDTPSARAQIQWEQQYLLINTSFASPARFWQSRYKTPPEIFEAYSNIKVIFDQIILEEQDFRAGGYESSPHADFRKFTSTAIMTETQYIADWGNSLAAQSQNDLISVVVGTSLSGVVLLAIISISSAWSLINIRKIIINSVSELKKGAEMVAHGNLEYRIPLRGKDEFGELAAAFNVMTSDLQGLYKNLERSTRVLQVIDSFNEVLMCKGDETTLLQESCRLLVEKGKYQLCWIGKAENDAEKTISLAPVSGAGSENFQSIKISWPDQPDQAATHPLARTIQTGSTNLVTGAEAIAQIHPEWTHFAAAGIHSMLILSLGKPRFDLLSISNQLGSGEHIWGALMIYSSLPDNFIPEEIVLLEDFASDLSYGLEAWSARIARDQAEEEVRKLNAELEQRVQKRTMDLLVINNELDAFSYSVSHDLRAPLRSMDGFSQALLDGYGSQLDETGRGYLHRIRTAAQRMALLIDALLRLSKVTRGEIQFGSVDLSGLANEVLDELRMTQPERVVETIISPNLVAQADANLIQIAINNLLRNAWKFTSKKDAARIEFGQIDMEGKQAFFVRDNGAGFDMAYAHNLFGAFQRLHSETEFEGSGIGLAMVRRIIQRHGGIVWAEAADGQGATFYFTLK